MNLACNMDNTETLLRGAGTLNWRQRRQLARMFLKDAIGLDREIPPLSAFDTAMLEQEYDRQTAIANGDLVRIVAATQTIPFAIRRAKRFASENRNVLDRLAQGDFSSLLDEISLWSRYAATLADPAYSDVLNWLYEAEVLSTRHFPRSVSGNEMWEQHGYIAAGIIRKIVTPTLDELQSP